MVAADHGELFACEAVWMSGATSLQFEHMWANVGSLDFQGAYVQLSHFLCGGERRFRRTFPRFVRVRPDEGGAWELAMRISRIDLDDRAVRGGEMTDYALGLNYYATANLRVMANLVYADLEDAGGSLLFGLRFGIDF